MNIPLQSEVTIKRPGWVSNGAYGRVVGYVHEGQKYIVHVPMMRATIRMSEEHLCRLDPPLRWALVDRNVTVSWQSLAQWTHMAVVPPDRRNRCRFLL